MISATVSVKMNQFKYFESEDLARGIDGMEFLEGVDDGLFSTEDLQEGEIITSEYEGSKWVLMSWLSPYCYLSRNELLDRRVRLLTECPNHYITFMIQPS
jgi:hypothetical protein